MARRWQVLGVVSIGVFMLSLDLFIVNIAFPGIERDFPGASTASTSWVLNSYAIALAALLVSAGRLADRHGRKRLFVLGLAVFMLGSALCGAAPSVWALVAARVVQAIGATLLLPTSLALLLPEFEGEERSRAIGIWAAVGGVAAAAGPPVGGLLIELSWRLVFLVNIPIGLVTILAAVRVLRESRDPAEERPDAPGSALIAVAIGALALGLVEAPAWGWGGARTLGALGVAATGLGAFWWRCLTQRSPVIDPSLLRVRSFALSILANLLFSAAFAAYLLANVLFMTSVWHESVLRAGLSLAPGPATAAIVALVSSRSINRLGPRTVAAAGIAVFALACLYWRQSVGAAPGYAAEMLPGLLAAGLGVGLVIPSLATAATSSVPRERAATGSAVYTMTRQVGFVLGISILVAILGTTVRPDAVAAFQRGWTFMLIAAALATVTALFIGEARHTPARAAEPLAVT